jgi:hypothetical protein|tara:strand:- start:337 stop:1104 length:768 start_codon:yes stop_codon:yes gene_type:complete
MKKLTPDQIQDNWNKLIQIIKDTFEEGSERRENLLKMYHYFEERMMFAPASAKEHYHNAFPGGYVEHILHIIQFAKEVKDMWHMNGAIINFTDEELIFSAMHHDLGKVGDLDFDYYTPQDSNWHRDNRGEIYKFGPELQYMKVPDRGLWILQHFGIKVTDKEYIGIKLTDGMYDEANKSYYVTYDPKFQLRSNLPYILHQADMMATRIEYDGWKSETKKEEDGIVSEPTVVEDDEVRNKKDKELQDLFKDLFKEE